VGRRLVQGWGGSRLRPRQGEAAEASEPQGVAALEVEVVLGQVHSRTVFTDVGIVLRQAAPRFVELGAGCRGKPDAGHLGLGKTRQKTVEVMEDLAARREKAVHPYVDGPQPVGQRRAVYAQRDGILRSRFAGFAGARS